jgi:acyl dehydratase
MSVKELSRPPSMRTLYPKAVAGSGRSMLRKLPGVGGGERALPDLELALHDVEVDRRHLIDYEHVCGFLLSDEMPATYPHVIAFPLSMELMTDSRFPFPAIGLVHVRNRIEQLRRIGAGERLSVRVRAEALREHDKGTQFDFVAEADADGEPAWRSRSTYLHREGDGDSSGKPEGERPAPPPVRAVWKLPGDIGRSYASVSGDRNPIHMGRLGARLFGMPRPIAHGMWLKARCLAALAGELPDRFAVDVSFKLPAYLPGKVTFSTWREDGGRAFALHDGKNEKPHLSGTVTKT